MKKAPEYGQFGRESGAEVGQMGDSSDPATRVTGTKASRD